VFGDVGASVVSLLESFSHTAEKRCYPILPTSDFEALIGELGRMNQVYWTEVLYRAHFAASTGLMRLLEWCKGAKTAHEQRNVLALAAALRGLLEASADTYEALSKVPLGLATCHAIIKPAIHGKVTQNFFFLPELETSLFHFAYARKLASEEEHRLYDAKTMKQYLRSLTDRVPHICDVYTTLCQYTHPSAATVFRFSEHPVDPSRLVFDPGAGATDLSKLSQLSDVIGSRPLVVAFGSCVMILKVLLTLGDPVVATPWAATVDMDGVEEWQAVRARLADPSPPAAATDADRERVMDELRDVARTSLNGDKRSRTIH
jgi:hypothetical protein